MKHFAVNIALSPGPRQGMLCECESEIYRTDGMWTHSHDPLLVLHLGAFPGRKQSEHHKKASTSKSPTIWPLRKNRRGFAKASVRRGFFPLLPCQGSRLCYLSQKELREKWKSRRSSMPNLQNPQRVSSSQIKQSCETVQDVMLHAQLHPRTRVSSRGHIYYFWKESANINSHIQYREQSL